MIARLIRWSIANRFLVLLATVMLSAWGVYSLQRTPLDALPDLSDVQVIIRTTYPGQAPRIVENQITYPMTTTMLSTIPLMSLLAKNRMTTPTIAPIAGADAATCRREVFRWLARYNTKRRHSHCRHSSPAAYERTLTPATLPEAA